MTARLFLAVAATEARKRLSYRADFWLQATAVFFVEFAALWFIWAAVFSEAGLDVIGGMTFRGTVLYAVTALLVGKLVRGREFEGAVSEDIYEGALSRYLLYPAPYLGLKYAQHVGALLPMLVQSVLFAALVPLLLHTEGFALSATSVALALPAILAANFLYYAMGYPVQAVSFWADNVWSLSLALRLLALILGGTMLPLSLFPPWAQDALAFTPFPHLAWWPAMTLLGRVGPAEALGHLAAAGGWCVGFTLLGVLVFRRGRLRYTGVGI